MKTLSLAIAALATGVVLHGQGDRPTADELARKLQDRYAAVQSFTANFIQESRWKHLPQVDKSSGTVKVLKPSRMWWEYDKPKKHWIVDGRYIWDWDVPIKVANRNTLPKLDEASTPLLFLAGRGDLTKDFTASLAPAQPDGEWHLELKPKAKDAGFISVTLIVRRSDLRLLGITTVDEQQTTATRFLDLVENAKLRPQDFNVNLPKDVQLITR